MLGILNLEQCLNKRRENKECSLVERVVLPGIPEPMSSTKASRYNGTGRSVTTSAREILIFSWWHLAALLSNFNLFVFIPLSHSDMPVFLSIFSQ